MVKFYGRVGYAQTVNKGNDIWEDEVTEKTYFGDVVRDSRRYVQGDKVNRDITIGNDIEIVADAYAENNAFAIRYVEWRGALWIVESFDVRSPRLLLRLGGVYTGPRPTTPGA